jgi:hypothetical protein
MRLTAVALAALVAVLTTPAIRAQGRGAMPKPPETPLSKTLYNVADTMGMLREANEADHIATIRYWAAGTMTVNGQAVKVSNYVGNVNYRIPGMRADITRGGADGKAEHVIEVVSDKYAWNETTPGVGAAPMPATVNARLLQIWMLPEGVVKAATAAGAAAKVAMANGTTTLTFPIASINANITATIDAKNFITQVEGRMGNTVVTTSYSDYGDYNGSDYLSDVLFPKHIVQKVGGATTLDITLSMTNTYNPYVIMPVPDSIAQKGQ